MKYERYIDGINYQQPCSNDNWYSFVDKNSAVLGKLGILKPTSEELKGISRRRIDVGNWQQKYLYKYRNWSRKQTRIFEGRPQQCKILGGTLQTSWPRKRAFLRSRCESFYRRLEVDVYDWDWEGRSSFYWPLSWLEPGLVYANTNGCCFEDYCLGISKKYVLGASTDTTCRVNIASRHATFVKLILFA